MNQEIGLQDIPDCLIIGDNEWKAELVYFDGPKGFGVY